MQQAWFGTLGTSPLDVPAAIMGVADVMLQQQQDTC